MTASTQLLRAAERMMGKGGSGAKGAWARGVALLTRQGLEGSLADLWSRRSPSLARCPARIQLLCFTVAGLDGDVTQRVRQTWAALSAACHHHPYEVGPTHPELREWLHVAETLEQAVAAQPEKGAPL